jgi:hypothetical protein
LGCHLKTTVMSVSCEPSSMRRAYAVALRIPPGCPRRASGPVSSMKVMRDQSPPETVTFRFPGALGDTLRSL